MTLAIVLPGTQQSRLLAQLVAAGVVDVRTADLESLAGMAATTTEPVLLCAGDVVAHTEVFRQLDAGPAAGTRALLLVAHGDDAPDAAPNLAGVATACERRGQLTAVALTPGTTPDERALTFGGVIRIGTPDLPALATAGPAAAATVAGARLAGDAVAPEPLDALLDALVAAGVTVDAYRLRELVVQRVRDPAQLAAAEAQLRAVDPDRARLRLAVKEHDDLFTTYCVSTWSPWVTKLAARLGASPTGVTVASVAFAGAAATLFAVGGRPLSLLGAVLLYLGFVLDCVDGQLARYTGRFSAFGGWLDTIADRGKEYLVYAGLGIGVEQSGLGNGWALATAAMVLQTVRHATDAWYGALHDEAARRDAGQPVPAGGSVGGSVGGRLSQVSDRVIADPGSLVYWAKRTVVFPIGERWALIAVTVALFNPLVSLVAVLSWGVLAAGYTLALRTLRAYAMRVPVLAAVDTARYRDDGLAARRLAARGLVARRFGGGAGRLPPGIGGGAGQLPAGLAGAATSVVLLVAVTGPLAIPALPAATALPTIAVLAAAVLAAAALLLATAVGATRPATGALDWLVPAALRAAEYLFVIAAGLVAAVPPPVTYGLLLVLALHHYDLTARLDKRLGPPPLHRWSLGWDGRVILLAAATAGPAVLAAVVTTLLAAYLLVIFVADAAIEHRRAGASARRRPAAPSASLPSAASPPPFHPAGRPAGTSTGEPR
ncbi:DUF5941 domain-containing protein [Solwaraspora sp. WMMB335]|uniref:DUF5941 domain-containing protein n=1 Tax=Solwaraspora sp. WMMB335 TaxID=3404118 RepID=UPI003B943A9D